MKIKITDVLPIVNPPEVGSVHTVTRRETEPPRNRRTKMYYILDYFTGILKAVYKKELSSAIGFKGIVKKIMVFVVIAVAYNVQRMTGDTIPLREIVIVFFICNEALSILENAAEFINIPQQLKDVLLQLRDKNAAKAEEKEESEE